MPTNHHNLLALGVLGLGLAFPHATADGTSPPAAAARILLPERIDLRSKLDDWGLGSRSQGKRPTCSVFTFTGALEFAVAHARQRGERLSVEFLNWSANQTGRAPRDGGFFSEMWDGFAGHGICAESKMPYQADFDPARSPGPTAMAEAKEVLSLGLRLNWIKPWNVKTGLSDDEFTAIKKTLSQGWPVCGGLRWPKQVQWTDGVLRMCPPAEVFDGHSVLLVGYRDDTNQPGGGVFIFRNTNNGGKDGSMPYSYAKAYMNDAVWVESTAKPGRRTTLLVTLPTESAWQDMAFLAAVPAATHVNNGAPSLVAIDASGSLSPQIADYLRRYRPETIYQIGGGAGDALQSSDRTSLVLADSADEAACKLSARFWTTSATAVVCPEDNYEAALVAAPLAARLRAPLLFASPHGLSQGTKQELYRLQAREVVVVGKLAGALDSAWQATELAGAADVMAWLRRRGLTVSYLAALNPLDRNQTVIKKLSLAGALLAAGRGGLTAPLAYAVNWKVPFSGVAMTTDVPAGLPHSRVKPKTGHLVFGGEKNAFILTNHSGKRGQQVYIDLNRDGSCTGTGEGPFVSGDSAEMDGKRFVITLGPNGAGKADVRLSWPMAGQLVADLQAYYEALGAPPEHLCLIGFPDAVPQAVFGRGGVVEEQTSDLPYANADGDPFAEIGVARVVAENASFGTLYASRVLTYDSLLDPEWQDRACQARWENTYGKLFENVGFDASYRHTEENLKWLEPPSAGKKGKREQTFEQDSPATRCAVLTHMDHSWWHELGHTFGWDAEVLLAPVVVESGGCLTAALDREADFHSVIARLFRQGAVAFAGNTREGCAQQELQRQEFWNGVLSGQTIGQAHRLSINSAMVTVLDKKEDAGGTYRYQMQIRTQFGDPAFAMRLPGPPRSEPARTTVRDDMVTVHAPAQWWPTKMAVPEDWKKWTGKNLFVLRGVGAYALRSWCKDEYDREETSMTAAFTTRRRVAKIEQVGQAPAPLGWSGGYHVDEHADGSRTYRWRVRLADFDQVKGTIVSAIGQLDYRVVYE